MPHEMMKREGVADHVAEDANFAPEARLLKHSKFFAKLRSQKHEFAAVFGKKAAKPFEGMRKARIDVNHAVDSMVRLHKELKNSWNPEDKKLWNEFYRTAFSSRDSKQDPLSARIRKQVEAMEPLAVRRSTRKTGRRRRPI